MAGGDGGCSWWVVMVGGDGGVGNDDHTVPLQLINTTGETNGTSWEQVGIQ